MPRYIHEVMTIKVDNVSINRQFLETDDEEQACALLFNTYYKIVFAKIDGMMRNHPDPAVEAKDMVQETLIKAFKERKTLREPEKLQGWLLTIATNLTRNEIRDAKRRRQIGDTSLESLDSPSIGAKEAHHAALLAATDAKQAEVERDMKAIILLLLQGKDQEFTALTYEGFTIREIAEAMDATPDAVQKRWERFSKWLIPIARNLEDLVDCLPERIDRKIMERYLDGQPLSEITEALGISRSKVEQTVKRAIAQWKKAAKDNPADPISAMVNNER